MSIFEQFQNRYESRKEEEMSLQEYLDLCAEDPSAYANAPERMLKAIGEPKKVDTQKDPRLGRIFMNRELNVYEPFEDFYGLEDTIEQVVSFFKHAAQGLEEQKQVLYLLGPVGGGKSSLAERLKTLMEQQPFYALKAGDQISPVYESPLSLFDPEQDAEQLENEYGIPKRYIKSIMSPWASKRLEEFGGDVTQFRVVKMYPSQLRQVGVTKVEPGDENNQDISSLTGKVDIRELENYPQDDPDAYSYSGGLNIATQGMLEFVEMFKAPLKMLHPLLTATQEGHYNGTEGFAAMPFQGIILAHSNESEWQSFRNNKNNEAFLDRINIIKVPYCLRVTEEEKIYQKLLRHSSLADAPYAPGTLEMMSQFSVLTRLKEPEDGSSIFSKMEVYDGKDLKNKDPHAKSLQEYKDTAGVDEGMDGMSTRFAFKILSKTFNYDPNEIAANPVHLMYVLSKQIEQEQLPADLEDQYMTYIRGILKPKYAEFLSDEIQKAFIESYSSYGQNIFDRYVMYADHWLQDNDFRDPDTGERMEKDELEKELEKIEKPAGITNPKDFRNEVVTFVLRERANNNGQNPDWTEYEKMQEVIENNVFKNTEELLPVISFSAKKSTEEEQKHADFVERMMEKGYTEKQVRLLVDWHIRYQKSH